MTCCYSWAKPFDSRDESSAGHRCVPSSMRRRLFDEEIHAPTRKATEDRIVFGPVEVISHTTTTLTTYDHPTTSILNHDVVSSGTAFSERLGAPLGVLTVVLLLCLICVFARSCGSKPSQRARRRTSHRPHASSRTSNIPVPHEIGTVNDGSVETAEQQNLPPRITPERTLKETSPSTSDLHTREQDKTMKAPLAPRNQKQTGKKRTSRTCVPSSVKDHTQSQMQDSPSNASPIERATDGNNRKFQIRSHTGHWNEPGSHSDCRALPRY